MEVQVALQPFLTQHCTKARVIKTSLLLRKETICRPWRGLRQVKASHLTRAYPGFFIEVFVFSPLDGMPVHRRATPSIDSGPVERGTASVKCLAQDLFHYTILILILPTGVAGEGN